SLGAPATAPASAGATGGTRRGNGKGGGTRRGFALAPSLALDAHDRVPCGRGLVARLIDRARGCSTAAAATAAAAGMLHGWDEPQHAGQPSGLTETGLPGWGGRTRTQKCLVKISL